MLHLRGTMGKNEAVVKKQDLFIVVVIVDLRCELYDKQLMVESNEEITYNCYLSHTVHFPLSRVTFRAPAGHSYQPGANSSIGFFKLITSCVQVGR